MATTHRQRPARGSTRNAARRGLLAGGLLLALLAGCGEPVPQGRRPSDWSSDPEQPHPVLERDLPEIRRTGTLRMIAFYNSISYFIHRGGQAGFDYELVSRFARERDLVLEVVVARPGSDLITMLNTGQGDLVCTGLPPEAHWQPWVRWTRPTNFVRKVVVTAADGPRPRDLGDLDGMTLVLPDDDPFRGELPELLRARGVRPRLVGGPPLAGPEELLDQVRDGLLPAVVVDDLVARASQVHAPGLRIGPAVSPREPTAWLVRANSPDLLAELNRFLKGHLTASPSGRTRRSRDYGIIHERYFSNRVTIAELRQPDDRPDKSGRISPWDEEVRRLAGEEDLDWRLVVALMFQESRFDPAAVSQAGARGLMQVLPRVAGAQADSLHVPAANLRAGVRLLAAAWQRYAYLDSLDRLRFSLAEYHAGFGHLTDARRLAMDLGRNPNAWEGHVATTLPLLTQRRWFDATRHGFYGGRETVAYVREILGRYRAYMRLVPREPAPAAPGERSVPLAALPAARPDPP